MHEAQLHDENMFLTLTYNNEHLPLSISRREMQLFIKRLRKSLGSKKIRYVYCGEYGEKNQRPHYHLLIFGHSFDDQVPHQKLKSGYIYTSKKLDALWGKGFASIGSVTFESAAYVARYCLKKITGKEADKAYERVDPSTGEIVQITPEFFQASLKPGIGVPWLEKYKSDVYPHDEVIVRGHKTRPPRAYDNRLPEEEVSPIKSARLKRARKHKDNNTPERLRDRELLQTLRVNEKLPRSL